MKKTSPLKINIEKQFLKVPLLNGLIMRKFCIYRHDVNFKNFRTTNNINQLKQLSCQWLKSQRNPYHELKVIVARILTGMKTYIPKKI